MNEKVEVGCLEGTKRHLILTTYQENLPDERACKKNCKAWTGVGGVLKPWGGSFPGRGGSEFIVTEFKEKTLCSRKQKSTTLRSVTKQEWSEDKIRV